MQLIQEAHDGVAPLDQEVKQNEIKHGLDAARQAQAGRAPHPHYAQLHTAADLLKVLDHMIQDLAQVPDLGLGAPVLARLKPLNLNVMSQTLAKVAQVAPPQKP
jgi:hypothetical protein